MVTYNAVVCYHSSSVRGQLIRGIVMAVKKKAMAKKKATMNFHRMPDGTMMAGKTHGYKKKK
jgi:hypothetical protein